ncbi:MAG: aspartate/glutamate racemase family protein [Alphaproteobacteria bacterium]
MPVYRTRPRAESYGQAVGILLLDGRAPFIPGDVGNASSYDYPVVYKTVEGLTTLRCLAQEPGWEEKVVAAARELEDAGVRGISSDCGFMIQYQPAVAAALRIPVYLSSLLQLRTLARFFAPDRPIGIVTADSGNFSVDFLRRTGTLPPNPIVIRGLQDEPEFGAAIMRESGTLDSDRIADEAVAACQSMQAERPDLAAILLECSVLPPYAKRVQDAVGLPVFDFISMIDYAVSGSLQRAYSGVY